MSNIKPHISMFEQCDINAMRACAIAGLRCFLVTDEYLLLYIGASENVLSAGNMKLLTPEDIEGFYND